MIEQKGYVEARAPLLASRIPCGDIEPGPWRRKRSDAFTVRSSSRKSRSRRSRASSQSRLRGAAAYGDHAHLLPHAETESEGLPGFAMIAPERPRCCPCSKGLGRAPDLPRRSSGER